MAKKKEHTATVTKRIGSKKDGSPKVHLIKGQPIEGLSNDQVKNYKSLKYIE